MNSFCLPRFYFLFSIIILAECKPAKGQDSTVVPLWKNGAPGFESRKNEPEQAKDWWVRNVHNPTVTVFLPPKEIATGTAVIICPGGGFRNLVFNAEGVDAARFLNKLGVAAFVLKYRLFREEDSPYQQMHAVQDMFRAMRLVKSRANDFGIDTARLGVMGFSAGGEMAGWVTYHFNDKNFTRPDDVDKLFARPSFEILVYPGPLAVPDSVASSSPPAFLVAANDDECCSEPIVRLLQMHRQAKVPVEVHLYALGNHAFNMGARSLLNSIKTWPQRLSDWLKDNGWLQKK